MKLQCSYISNALHRPVDLVIVLPSPQYGEMFGTMPPDYTPKAKYPVIYLLHGKGGDCNSWFSYTQAEMFAEEHGIALVGMSGENKCFANCGEDKFEQFLREELPQVLCGNFCISEKPEDTYICGLSMGGFGAMLNYLKAPDRYGAVGCFSAAFDKYPELAKDDESYDLYKFVASNKALHRPFSPIYIACGKDDFLLDNTLHFTKALKENGVDFTLTLEEGYSHEWRFWNRQLEMFIKWLPRKDAYAKVFKRL